MKKILLTIFLALASMCLFAQGNLKNLQSDLTVHKAGLDTVTNTGSVSQILQISGWQDLVTVQAGVTKLTGTSGGTVKLLGSVDNVRYEYVNNTPDSLIVANVAGLQVKTWVITPSKYQYYKAVFKGTGTHTTKIETLAMWRKQ